MNKRRLEGYRIVAELGRGGMSTVYKAVQESLERTVAIKEIHPNFAGSPELIARFEREARAIAQLSHPCIVQIYDYIHEGDAHFMVMEYIEGIDLKSALERRGRLSPEETLAFVVRISAALAYAHAAGIIHRDIKPSNILLTREGQVKVVDFGIARMEEGEELTRTGAFVGTPAYMSPEQILGERLDGRADIFSLGVVMYEALAGEKPFTDDAQASVSARILKAHPPRLRRRAPGVSRQLERIVMRCLEKQRDRRFGSMSELNLAVRAALPRGERQRPRALISLAARLQEAPAGRRRRSVLSHTTESLLRLSSHRAAGLAAALLLAAGLAAGLWYIDGSPRRAAGGPPAPRPAIETAPWSAEAAARGESAAVEVAPAAPAPPLPAAGESEQAVPEAAPALAPAEGPAAAPAGRAQTSNSETQTYPDPAPASAGSAGAAAPAREPGFLKLVVRPWAEVKVDGKLHDVTPFEAPIPLAPGDHTIDLIHETLPPRRLTVTARSGETRRLDVDLRR
jgi:predicted Ser/Thr protein kinase